MNLINKFISIFKRKQHYKLQQVFTPTSYAELSYKRRPIFESRLKSSILQPGKQIIIYGHSGSGKSTLLYNVLKDNSILSITSQCINNTTVDDLMLDAFDKLNKYYIATVSDNDTISNTANLKLEYQVISTAITSVHEVSHAVEQKRVLPPQLTPQRLASFLGAAGYIWIIEDFHKVVQEEKIKLAQIMKLFVDASNTYSKVKIIAIGAAETGHEVVECDSELDNRVMEIGVPLLNPHEIMDILNTGTELLNIKFEDDLKEKIVRYSNSLATIAHQLAYNICDINDICETRKESTKLGVTELNQSLTNFLNDKEDTFTYLYNKITEQRSGKYQNVELILKAIVELPGNEISQHDILLKINESESNYPQGNLSTYLKKMCSPEWDEVLRLNAGRYTFSNPFFKAYIRMRHGLSEEITVDE
ncbi:MAG: hypothetical protein GXY16_04270 [Syntrophomonadaceae bacterium]|nr:hypothetical protein [Syntrophomonadaceae bacterium]